MTEIELGLLDNFENNFKFNSFKFFKKQLLLEVEDLYLSFIQYERGLRKKEIKVLNGMNLNVYSGEIVAVIGSSGSGKSLLAHSIMGILPRNSKLSGKIKFKGSILNIKNLEKLRGIKIALIPQSVNFLDPLIKVGKQARFSPNSYYPLEELRKIFKKYNLNTDVEKLYPFQLSGGMARRVLIATAMISDAELIIADEPTPGMHSEAVKQTMKEFRQIANSNKGLILITHDISSVLDYVDRIAVFYSGTTLELTTAENFKKGVDFLYHPYTKALWQALPSNGFNVLEGFQPLASDINSGCPFAQRCNLATEKCFKNFPHMQVIDNIQVRCFYAA